jgi:hypothetical protein
MVYYTFQESDGRPFPDPLKKQTWSITFQGTVTFNELKIKLAMWHSLNPSCLTLFDSSNTLLEEESCLSSCTNFPIVVTVEKLQIIPESPKVIVSELPISLVLLYLLTREKKYKPIVMYDVSNIRRETSEEDALWLIPHSANL